MRKNLILNRDQYEYWIPIGFPAKIHVHIQNVGLLHFVGLSPVCMTFSAHIQHASAGDPGDINFTILWLFHCLFKAISCWINFVVYVYYPRLAWLVFRRRRDKGLALMFAISISFIHVCVVCMFFYFEPLVDFINVTIVFTSILFCNSR